MCFEKTIIIIIIIIIIIFIIVIGMGEPGLYDTPDAVARVIHSLGHVYIVGIPMVPVMKRTTR